MCLHMCGKINTIKGGVSDFWKPMLTFEITKTKMPLPQKGLAPILIAPPHTYVWQRLVLWNKAKPMLLTYREETKQPRRPITGLPAPWVLSSAGKLIRYLHGSYFLLGLWRYGIFYYRGEAATNIGVWRLIAGTPKSPLPLPSCQKSLMTFDLERMQLVNECGN